MLESPVSLAGWTLAYATIVRDDALKVTWADGLAAAYLHQQIDD
jgi:hypothetical protein